MRGKTREGKHQVFTVGHRHDACHIAIPIPLQDQALSRAEETWLDMEAKLEEVGRDISNNLEAPPGHIIIATHDNLYPFAPHHPCPMLGPVPGSHLRCPQHPQHVPMRGSAGEGQAGQDNGAAQPGGCCQGARGGPAKEVRRSPGRVGPAPHCEYGPHPGQGKGSSGACLGGLARGDAARNPVVAILLSPRSVPPRIIPSIKYFHLLGGR